jgi:hypothetical protein
VSAAAAGPRSHPLSRGPIALSTLFSTPLHLLNFHLLKQLFEYYTTPPAAAELDGGQVHIFVKYRGVPVYAETDDLCQRAACPVAPGDLELGVQQALPLAAPPVSRRGCTGTYLQGPQWRDSTRA